MDQLNIIYASKKKKKASHRRLSIPSITKSSLTGKPKQYIARDKYIAGKTIMKNKKTKQMPRQRSPMGKREKEDSLEMTHSRILQNW